jgi:hypothetical protein
MTEQTELNVAAVDITTTCEQLHEQLIALLIA